MYRLLIFDLDGTLLNTIDDLANASNYALSQFGFEVHEVDKYKTFVGDGVYKLVDRMLPKEHRSEEVKIKVKEAFDKYYKEHSLDCTKPYEGILELLEYLKARGVKVAVVSNKSHAFVSSLVKRIFGEYIQLAYGQREGIPTKPDPFTVLEVIEKLGYQKEECIYIGDTNVDIYTGKNAGLKTVGVLWGFRTKQELIEAGADYIAKEVQDLYKLTE